MTVVSVDMTKSSVSEMLMHNLELNFRFNTDEPLRVIVSHWNSSDLRPDCSPGDANFGEAFDLRLL